MKNGYILRRGIHTTLGKENMNQNLACQMPNLANIWHFPTMADRAIVTLIKVDQLYKRFLKLYLGMPNVPKCQIWNFFGIL